MERSMTILLGIGEFFMRLDFLHGTTERKDKTRNLRPVNILGSRVRAALEANENGGRERELDDFTCRCNNTKERRQAPSELESFQKTCQISSAFPILLLFNAASCTNAFIMIRAED